MAVDSGGSRNRRRIVLGTVILGVLSIFVRVAALTRSLLASAAVVAILLGLFWWLVGRSRERTEAALAASSDGPPSANGALDFGSLPEQWRNRARETLSAAAASSTAMNVSVRADGGWFVVEKRRALFGGKTPFTLRVPLAALVDAQGAKPKIGLVGSSLTFGFSTGDELVFDIMAGQAAAEAVARRFQDAAATARMADPPGPLTLEVTTEPPPPRTPSGLAAVMMMSCFIPFAIAMAGAVDGPFAALGSMFLFFAGLGLLMVRPVSMGRVLALGAWAVAAAFGVDTLLTGQYLRLVGVAVCIALATWMRSSPRRTSL